MTILILVFVLAMAMWGLNSLAKGVSGASEKMNRLADHVEASRPAGYNDPGALAARVERRSDWMMWAFGIFAAIGLLMVVAAIMSAH